MSWTLANVIAIMRRGYLNDNVPDAQTGEYSFSDALITDAVHMALTTFAQHTAVATATAYPIAGDQYTLPDNLLDDLPFDQCGLVSLSGGSLREPTYLNPVRYTPDSFYTGQGFYTRPSTTLRLTKVPTEGATINVEYYAYYDPPYLTTDEIRVPIWGRLPIVLLASAHTLGGVAVKSATIRQWGAKPDTGSPTDNSVGDQQAYLFKLYEQEMARVVPQNRVSQWRTLRPDRP